LITKNVATLAVLVCSLGANASLAAEPPGEKHIYKKIEDRQLGLYISQPADWQANDRRPAVLFFHGGGWTGGAPGQFTEHAKYFASRGMVAIQVQYRLLKGMPKATPTICVRDAKSAMRWVRGRANMLGIDPKRIASAGGSAGGHLAAFVAMVDGSDDPQDDKSISAKSNAMVLFNPVFDNGPDGWGYSRVGDRYKEFSPFHNISADDGPAIVFLGSADKLVPVKTAYDFRDQMKKTGNRCDVMIFKDMPHGFFNHGRYKNRPYTETVIAADRFLASLGWLSGEPTLSQ